MIGALVRPGFLPFRGLLTLIGCLLLLMGITSPSVACAKSRPPAEQPPHTPAADRRAAQARPADRVRPPDARAPTGSRRIGSRRRRHCPAGKAVARHPSC